MKVVIDKNVVVRIICGGGNYVWSDVEIVNIGVI